MRGTEFGRPHSQTLTTSGDDCYAPLDATIPEPEVRPARFLAPDGRMQAGRTILVTLHFPARPLVGKQIHMKYCPAAAWTYHRRLLLKSIVLDNVDGSPFQFLWQLAVDHYRSIRRNNPLIYPRPCSPKKVAHALHVLGLSANSSKPSSGVASPNPALSPKMSQSPSSAS